MKMMMNAYGGQQFLHYIITKLQKMNLKTYLKKIKHKDKTFSSHQRGWGNFEQNNASFALNVLFASQNSEEITLVFKSEHKKVRRSSAFVTDY